MKNKDETDENRREVILWGGIGEKKSNNGTQYYLQNRIFDSEGISPCLTQAKSNYWIIIKERLDED